MLHTASTWDGFFEAAYATEVWKDTRNAYKILVEKPKRKRPLRRPRRKWGYNIKIDVMEMWWEGTDWINLSQDRDRLTALVNTAMNSRVP
jgi:hypothetical protein